MADRTIGDNLSRRGEFVWLDPPASLGAMTIVDVSKAKDFVEHQELVKRWSGIVWEAWVSHQETVREWAKHTYS